MSYTRIATATATIVISFAAAVPGTQPAAAAGGLAGSLPPLEPTSPHRLALQAPAAQETPAPVFTTTINTETPEQAEMAERALEQMATAGLEMPPVTIYIHSDRADCSNDPGRTLNGYFAHIDGENIVHSCGNYWTLLHELAHAWDHSMLDDETRQQFMDHQGLNSWHNQTWHEAGGEHLASIVAWAIEGTHPSRIGYYDQSHLAEAYEIATGEPAPVLVAAGPAAGTSSAPVAVTNNSAVVEDPR